jgi:hypothetical protein
MRSHDATPTIPAQAIIRINAHISRLFLRAKIIFDVRSRLLPACYDSRWSKTSYEQDSMQGDTSGSPRLVFLPAGLKKTE